MAGLLQLAKYYIKKIPSIQYTRVNNVRQFTRGNNSSNVHISGNGVNSINGVLYKNSKKLDPDTPEYAKAAKQLDKSMVQLDEAMKIFDNPRFPFI